MSVKSTAAKAALIIIAVIVVIALVSWFVGLFATWLYDLAFAWWLDPINQMMGDFATFAYTSVYQVTDDIGTALGGLGGTVETNLVTGIVNTVANAANDFVNWFVGLFYQASQVLGG